jgi:hypothetical protein
MGNVFLACHGADSDVVCGRIADSQCGVFGANMVRRGVGTLSGGVDYRRSVESALSQSQVGIALIGPTWATVTDDQGRRRIEIESALVRRTAITPVPVLGGRVPPAQVLPSSIAQLSFLNAHETHDDPPYQADRQRVIEGMAYFIPLLPTDQSRLQQQANAAFIQAQQVARQAAPMVKTVWTGGISALFVFSVILVISGIGTYFAMQSFSNFSTSVSSTGFNNDPTAQSFQGYSNSLTITGQAFAIDTVVLGVSLAITAMLLLRPSSRRRRAAVEGCLAL